MTWGSFKVVVETPIEVEWGRSSSSDVQAGPFLSAMSGRLFSRYGFWGPLSLQWVSTLYLLWINSSLVVFCSHLSHCGRGTPL